MRRRPSSAAIAVLALFVILAFVVALTARTVIHDEENRLLGESAREVGAQLDSSIAATESSLRSLGTQAQLPDADQGFDAAGSSLLVGPVRSVALLQPEGTGFSLRTSLGQGWPTGLLLSGQRLALFKRSQNGPAMVSSVINDGYRTRLGFAISLPPDQGGDVVYLEDAIDPSNPIANAALSPSSSIQVSFYASATPIPTTLVLASAWPQVQRTGYVQRVNVGADQWTLVVHAIRPLTGDFTTLVPVLLLMGGIVSALLAAGMAEVLVRRRDFALRLVAERTSELQLSFERLEAAQAELRHQAFHDSLTGLPNRVLLMDRIGQALARSRRRSTGVALLFMDIDRFKWVNDSLGHSAGDEVLVASAARLLTTVRSADTVARLGGDEFVVICEDVESPAEAESLARRLAERLTEPLEIDGKTIRLTVSAGVAVAAPDATAFELLRDGDIAMYHAKDRGRDRVEMFDRDMRSKAASRLPVEAALRSALDNGEISVFYQPVVSPSSGAVVGVEALARWTDPKGRVHPPSEFIGIAEETGLIIPLGTTVLTQACQQARTWNESHPDHQPLSVSVNLSARQLERAGLTDLVDSALSASGLDHRDLWLEITETVLMDERGPCPAALKSLSELGVTLVVDDFGTGYSSLLYLHRLPVDVLKIDQSFVAGMGKRRADDAIVTSLVSLAHDLGLTAVAEGVETRAQAEGLAALGCDMAQGYHWSRPAPHEDLSRWLESHWPPRPSVPTLTV